MAKDKKYTPSTPFHAYDLLKSGLSESKTAATLGVSPQTFMKWKAERPEFAEAVRRAYANQDEVAPVEEFKDYVYKHLSPHLQDLWDEIHACDKAKTSRERVEALLEKAGKPARQALFVHALVSSNFNASEACRKVGIARSTLTVWTADPKFRDLMEEVRWHKGNFFEGALVRLVKSGDAAATIFANKTVNKDRGYGTVVDVKHTGGVEVNHVVSIDAMDLDLETRRKLLQALRDNDRPRETEVLAAITAPESE